jgi:hypothetical protein
MGGHWKCRVAPVGAVESIDQSRNAGAPLSALMRGALIIWIANPPSATDMTRMDKNLKICSGPACINLILGGSGTAKEDLGHDAITMTAKQIVFGRAPRER